MHIYLEKSRKTVSSVYQGVEGLLDLRVEREELIILYLPAVFGFSNILPEFSLSSANNMRKGLFCLLHLF